MPTIVVDHASKYYYSRPKRIFRREEIQEIGVEDADFMVEQGEFVFVIGSSGAGKSTLMQLLAGQVAPDKGSVKIAGRNLTKLGKSVRRRLPLLVGYVSQQHSMEPRSTIKENLEAAAKIGKHKFKDEGNYGDRVRKVLGLVGLPGVENRYPVELTSGECRRIELAGTLINSPPILVLDEVTANLDADSMWDMYLLLHEINQMGTTVIMSTHNIDYVNMLRRRVITLVDGRVYSDEVKGRYGEITKREI